MHFKVFNKSLLIALKVYAQIFIPHKMADEKSQRTNNIPTPQISFRASIHPAKGCRIAKVKRCRLPKLPPMHP